MIKKNFTNTLRLWAIPLFLAIVISACGTKPESTAVLDEPILSTPVPATAAVDEPVLSTPIPATEDPHPSYLPLIEKLPAATEGQLIVSYGFSVFALNKNRDGFEKINPQGFNELRSISWSPDGQILAMVGTGGVTVIESNIKFFNPVDGNFQSLISDPMPYLMDMSWSHDGKRLVTWTLDEKTVVYLVNKDGSGLTKVDLNMQIFGRPQFAADDASLYFVGANETSSGLFEVGLDGSFIRQVSSQVAGTEAFAWSPEGSRLAYIEVDWDKKESRLIVEAKGGSKITAMTFPFSELTSDGNTHNLQWTPDGKYILFDIEARLGKSMIYVASADGSESGKLLEAARVPSISADGKWLAYFGIREKASPQLMLVDFASMLSSPLTASPIHIVNLPIVRNGFEEMDKLNWKP